MYDLRRSIAASDAEIEEALNAALAVEVDGSGPLDQSNTGYVYRISPLYATNLLDLILTMATADSLPLKSLSLNDVMRSLASEEERPECIQVILKTFSDQPFERTYLSIPAI